MSVIIRANEFVLQKWLQTAAGILDLGSPGNERHDERPLATSTEEHAAGLERVQLPDLGWSWLRTTGKYDCMPMGWLTLLFSFSCSLSLSNPLFPLSRSPSSSFLFLNVIFIFVFQNVRACFLKVSFFRSNCRCWGGLQRPTAPGTIPPVLIP